MRHVRFLVPEGIDDPARVSGGNVYDRAVRDGLRGRGWDVDLVEVADDPAALTASPDGALVLVDGLVADRLAQRAPDAVDAAAPRIRLVVLAHMVAAAFPDADASTVVAERRSLAAADRVIVTSRWTADELAARSLVRRERIAVASPGVRAGVYPPGAGNRLLCIGVVAPHKGQDVLLDALALLQDQDWECTIVGSTDASPEYAARIAARAETFGGRVRLPGVLVGEALEEECRRSALIVAPSRVEASGMAIADARARGIPVIAAAVGGIPDTVAGGGAMLVGPDDPAALAEALRRWMTDPALRARLRAEAVRATVPDWNDTLTSIEEALAAA